MKHICVKAFFVYGSIIFLLIAGLGGCASGVKQVNSPMENDMPETDRIRNRPPTRHDGSLWQPDSPLSGLFMDYKARAVGDIVTISIVEKATAYNEANTNTARESSLEAGIENFFNMEKKFPASKPFFNPFSSTSIKGGLKSDFDGSGKTSRLGGLTADITARVTDVLPNGNLRISGAREVTVNNERQFLTISGIIQPRDISSANKIESTRISDAKIVYSGSGIINDRQRPGWMARVIDYVWPF